jgi:ABC-type amino acid transport substrate-binding protein
MVSASGGAGDEGELVVLRGPVSCAEPGRAWRAASLPLLILAASFLAAAPAPTPASSPHPQDDGGDLAQVRARGRLLVEVYPLQDSHFVSLDLDVVRRQGLTLGQLHRPEHFHGVEIDLLKGFAARLGVPLEFVASTSSIANILQAVVDRQVDLAASGLMVTPARLKKVDFSAPYHSSWLAVVVRRDSRIAAPADLAGKRAAAIEGSSHLEFLRAAVPDAKIELTSFDLEGLNLVDQGRADFTLLGTNDPPGGPADPELPALKIAFRLRRLDTGIAMRKRSDLAVPLNTYIASLKQSGELDRILARHDVHRAPAGPAGAAAVP